MTLRLTYLPTRWALPAVTAVVSVVTFVIVALPFGFDSLLNPAPLPVLAASLILAGGLPWIRARTAHLLGLETGDTVRHLSAIVQTDAPMDPSVAVDDLLKQLAAIVGESIAVERITFEVIDNGPVMESTSPIQRFPMIHRGSLVGVIQLVPAHPLTEVEHARMEQLATFSAPALANALVIEELNEKLSQLRETGELLVNRRRATVLEERTARKSVAVSVLAGANDILGRIRDAVASGDLVLASTICEELMVFLRSISSEIRDA